LYNPTPSKGLLVYTDKCYVREIEPNYTTKEYTMNNAQLLKILRLAKSWTFYAPVANELRIKGPTAHTKLRYLEVTNLVYVCSTRSDGLEMYSLTPAGQDKLVELERLAA
jgi:hypothetical protein